MTARLITPPAALAVSIEAARAQARTGGNALDAELEMKIQGFTEKVEHDTGRALIHQTWEVTLDRFSDSIRLPNAPLVRVESVKFYDTEGVLRTLDPQDYQVDAKSEPGYIIPAVGRAWPATAARINSVEVQYVCGYGPDHESVPSAIRQYILAMIENDYYPNPNAQYLCRLLDRYMVYL
jgi:uncharacterized phiE125 gp8 family phage protein